MVGTIKLKSTNLIAQRKVGEAIIRLVRSYGDTSPGSEWRAFNLDHKAWLFQNGYEYIGPGAGPEGQIPESVNLKPVYDTADTMHVRIPWAGDLNTIPTDIMSDDYGALTGARRFPVFLARYFMRKCR